MNKVVTLRLSDDNAHTVQGSELCTKVVEGDQGGGRGGGVGLDYWEIR